MGGGGGGGGRGGGGGEGIKSTAYEQQRERQLRDPLQ